MGVHLGEDRVPFHMWSGVRNGPVLPGGPCPVLDHCGDNDDEEDYLM